MATRNKQFNIDVGQRIRNARKENRLTIADLAEKSGLSEKCVNRAENGDTSPNIMTIYALCTALKISADQILGLDWITIGNELADSVKQLNCDELQIMSDLAKKLVELRKKS